jgi:hypothetical protein
MVVNLRTSRCAPAALAIAALLPSVTGCSAPADQPCAGLDYTDAGVTREQYAPCAKAMTRKLDEVWRNTQDAFNYNLSDSERALGRQACLKTSSELARLINQAGGTDRLTRLDWADAELSQFNRDIEHARNQYVVACLYGDALGMTPSQIDGRHLEARHIADSLP